MLQDELLHIGSKCPHRHMASVEKYECKSSAVKFRCPFGSRMNCRRLWFAVISIPAAFDDAFAPIAFRVL
jgi:hypothetical protein